MLDEKKHSDGAQMRRALLATSVFLSLSVGNFANAMTAEAESQNAPMMACAAIVSDAMANLDPNVKNIAGNEFSNKTFSDCEWLIEEAKGDPKRAGQGYDKLISSYSDYSNRMISSPLTDQRTRYVLVMLSRSYQDAIAKASHAAGNYEYLKQQADITKDALKGYLP